MNPNANPAPQSGPAAFTGTRGVSGEFMSLVGSLSRHVSALGSLAGAEAKEATALYVRLAVMLGAGLFFAAFGYILLWVFLAFLIATIFHVGWIWILLGFTLVHFLVAFVCANHVRTHWRTPVFQSTSAEIRRDLDALKPKP